MGCGGPLPSVRPSCPCVATANATTIVVTPNQSASLDDADRQVWVALEVACVVVMDVWDKDRYDEGW